RSAAGAGRDGAAGAARSPDAGDPEATRGHPDAHRRQRAGGGLPPARGGRGGGPAIGRPAGL
ncbi:MAG: hypothetical protein AVDCRST_MAG33-1045, partial [uncultured Thermomicrobiales bacterium]